jgi:hypothetical protein
MKLDLINDKFYVPVENVQRLAETVMQSDNTDNGKIHALLHLDAQMYQNLGKESTAADKAQVKIQSRKLYRMIKELNEEMGRRFLIYLDGNLSK